MLRIAIFGLGSIGQRHLFNARALGHDPVGFDVDPERGHDPATFAAGQFDAAVIATPASTHLSTAQELAACGFRKALFVEKPIDVSLANAGFWRAWPHPAQMAGYNWRFIESVRNQDRRDIKEVSALTRTNMASWPGTGYASALLEGSHDIDLLRMLIGRLARVTYSARNEFGAWNLELQSDKAKASWRFWPNSPNAERALWVNGRRVYLFDGTKAITAAVEPTYCAELGAFLKAAEAGTSVQGAATFEDGLAVVGIVEQAESLCATNPREATCSDQSE